MWSFVKRYRMWWILFPRVRWTLLFGRWRFLLIIFRLLLPIFLLFIVWWMGGSMGPWSRRVMRLLRLVIVLLILVAMLVVPRCRRFFRRGWVRRLSIWFPFVLCRLVTLVVVRVRLWFTRLLIVISRRAFFRSTGQVSSISIRLRRWWRVGRWLICRLVLLRGTPIVVRRLWRCRLVISRKVWRRTRRSSIRLFILACRRILMRLLMRVDLRLLGFLLGEMIRRPLPLVMLIVRRLLFGPIIRVRGSLVWSPRTRILTLARMKLLGRYPKPPK